MNFHLKHNSDSYAIHLFESKINICTTGTNYSSLLLLEKQIGFFITIVRLLQLKRRESNEKKTTTQWMIIVFIDMIYVIARQINQNSEMEIIIDKVLKN